jgi:hypothetical protein
LLVAQHKFKLIILQLAGVGSWHGRGIHKTSIALAF